MSHRYSTVERWSKILYRKIVPVPTSPWTKGTVADICAIELVPPTVLQSFFSTCIALLQSKKGADIGDYLEFGVFNGSSLSSMYHTAKRTQLPIRYFGFDAFQGLPEGAEKEDDGVWEKGFYACSFDQMKHCLEKRQVPPDEIIWINGWYDNTLTQDTAREHLIVNPGIVFVDCDTYSSSKAVFDFLAPIIKQPAIFCLDDWKLNDLDVKGMGEYKSFNEFLENNSHLTATEIPSYNRKSKSFLIEPT